MSFVSPSFVVQCDMCKRSLDLCVTRTGDRKFELTILGKIIYRCLDCQDSPSSINNRKEMVFKERVKLLLDFNRYPSPLRLGCTRGSGLSANQLRWRNEVIQEWAEENWDHPITVIWKERQRNHG